VGNVSAAVPHLSGCRHRFESLQLEAGRNLSDAFRTILRLVLNNTAGDRPEVPDVIVLMTHGLSDDRAGAVAEAVRVKSEGIIIIPVVMTSAPLDKLRQELKQIATNVDDVDNLMLISSNYYQSV